MSRSLLIRLKYLFKFLLIKGHTSLYNNMLTFYMERDKMKGTTFTYTGWMSHICDTQLLVMGTVVTNT